MDDLKKLQEEIKKEKYKKSVFNIIADTFWIWMQEFSNTVWVLFKTPNSWENQITKNEDDWENAIIKSRNN